ncbi:MAG: M48 family metalloprotease [Verrucomicrobia bacterium]|nr:M48 family metalloprotease [Verrucomicrobiota bacterium]
MDTFFQVILSNILIAAALAGAAWAVERWLKRPLLAHLLWLLIFVKLLCPPLLEVEAPLLSQTGTAAVEASWHSAALQLWAQAQTLILVCWLTGSAFVLISSLTRVFRFNQQISRYSIPAPEDIQRLARELAPRLKVKKLPRILITPARLSPLVWWTGGSVRILLPQILLDKMEPARLKWVLAHELAHISRRDHWIRWLEWLTAIVFWWNPLVYLGRDRLRANEEICCDDKVLSTLSVTPRQYASTLLDALEHLAGTEVQPPAMASAMNNGGYMEQRLKEIIMGRKPIISRCQKIAFGAGAAVILPLACLWTQSETPVETIQTARTEPEIIPLLVEEPSEPKLEIIPVDYVEVKDTDLILKQLQSALSQQTSSKRSMEETCRRMLELQMGSADPTLLPYQEELRKQLENHLNDPAAQEQLKQYQEQFRNKQEQLRNQQERLKKQQQEQLRKQEELKKQLEDQLRKLQRQLRRQQDVNSI